MASVLQDVVRASAIFSTLAGPFAGRVGVRNVASVAEEPKPYTNGRPSYGKGQVDTVWENAKTPDGRVFDPYTGEEIFWDKAKPRNGQWDMGHRGDIQYQDYHRAYMEGRISKEEFLRIHRNPDNYHPQSVYSNRSRRFD